MKIFKLTVSNLVGVIIICISFIPVYNRYLTHQRENTFDFNAKTLLLEYFLVFIFLFLLLISKTIFKKNSFCKRVNSLTKVSFLYVLVTFISVIFSQDFSRSMGLFAFGLVGPFLLYLIIVYKTQPNISNLKWLIKSFLISSLLFLFIGYLFAFRFGFSADLMEVRAGKNIYGSNSVIGTISFILPLIFISKKYFISEYTGKLLLRIFGLLAVVWTIISLSRWGYATLFLIYFLSVFFINKSFSIKRLVLTTILFFMIGYLIPDITELIVYRFTGSAEVSSFNVDNIYDRVLGEYRLVRWNNAFTVIENNLFFGIGLGNNYLVDPFGNSDAHNLFINMLIEQGILVFLAILLVFNAVYKLIRNMVKYSNNSVFKILVIALGIGLLAFHFWSLTGGTYIQASGIISAVKNYYFFISMGLIAYIAKFDDDMHSYNIIDTK